MAISVSSVKTDLFTMDYFRFGTGSRTMVILPGLSIQSVIPSAELVAQAYQSFARDYTVYVFDRRKDLPPSYSIGEMAKDTVIAIQTLGLTDIYLFGASQGGMIAQVIAIRFPGLVHKLVLGSSACHIGEETPEAVAQWILLAREQLASLRERISTGSYVRSMFSGPKMIKCSAKTRGAGSSRRWDSARSTGCIFTKDTGTRATTRLRTSRTA